MQQVGTGGMYTKIIKVIYNQPTTNIMFNSEKLKAFPQDQEQDKRLRITFHLLVPRLNVTIFSFQIFPFTPL